MILMIGNEEEESSDDWILFFLPSSPGLLFPHLHDLMSSLLSSLFGKKCHDEEET